MNYYRIIQNGTWYYVSWWKRCRRTTSRNILTLTVKEAKEVIEKFINFYNYRRLHQNLDYKTPNDVYGGAFLNRYARLSTKQMFARLCFCIVSTRRYSTIVRRDIPLLHFVFDGAEKIF
ncbi:MAG: integrase core domain-containing protein [Holosporaceae bacterium]|nr:integrase core domain-containing protein [Holosporaceae bacterium]